MGKLLQEEEEDGDTDFYKQDFWAEGEDDEYADADDEDGGDSFDSDFGDSTESDSDDEDGNAAEKAASKREPGSKRSVYKDPKMKAAGEKRMVGRGAASAAAARAASSHKKRPRVCGEVSVAPTFQRGALRNSTKDASAVAVEKRKVAQEMAAQRSERIAREGRGKGVELRRLTQEDILAEARQTEIINRASLEAMLRVEEEKRRVVTRDRTTDGPTVRFRSVRDGEAVQNTITFINCELPAELGVPAPPPPAPMRCAVTGLPAKYFDPGTNCPYATLDAFRMLRGRTGRRNAL